MEIRNEIFAPPPFVDREELGRHVVRDGNGDLVCTLHGEYAHRHAALVAYVLNTHSTCHGQTPGYVHGTWNGRPPR